jgi:Fic family protein
MQSSNTITQTSMMKDIETFISKYQTDKDFAKFIDKQYHQIMTTQFVLTSNRIEMVGTQSLHDTVRLLNSRIPKKTSTADAETLQTKEALQHVEKMFSEVLSQSVYQSECGYLTEHTILESHQIMTKGLCKDSGNYRKDAVGTFNDYGFVLYENPYNIPAKITGLIDDHNKRMSKFKKAPSLSHMIHNAAEWLYEFLRIHPFTDGNGRIARIWMAYMLRPYIPFMFSIPSGLRSRYILALQDHDLKGLEIIITESIWRNTKNALDAYGNLQVNT